MHAETQSQRGSGAFVAKQSNVSILKIDADILHDPGSFASIFELWGMIEVQSAALAAERRSDKDIEEFAGFISEMQSSLYGSVAWIDADLAFHRSVAKATRNTYVVDVIGFLAGRVRESILSTGGRNRTDVTAKVTVDEHLAMLEALRAGNAPAAQSSMSLSHQPGAAGGFSSRATASRRPGMHSRQCRICHSPKRDQSWDRKPQTRPSGGTGDWGDPDIPVETGARHG